MMVWHLQVPDDTFFDADGDVLTVTATLTSGQPLPGWLAFDPSDGVFGSFTGIPEAAGILSGAFGIRVRAFDGVAGANADFTLTIGDDSGLPLFVPIHSPLPQLVIFDCEAPAGAGVATVLVGLDKPARETTVFKLKTQDGDGGALAGSVFTSKTDFVTWHAGEQYKPFPVNLLRAPGATQSVNVIYAGTMSNKNGVSRGTGKIMSAARIAALATAGTPARLPPVTAPDDKPLPARPVTTGWTTVFNDTLRTGFEANDDGMKADGATPCWYTKPHGDAAPASGREQPGNNEDGYYADPVVNVAVGANPFPLVTTDIGSRRAVRAEYLNGLTIAGVMAAKTYGYTAAMLTTRRNFASITTGDYVEVRAKWTPKLHTWPAIWLMPGNGQWPPEIDMMEGFYGPNIGVERVSSTIHYGPGNTSLGSHFHYAGVSPEFRHDGWNTWGCYLGPTWVVFYINDKPYAMYPNMMLDRHGPLSWYLLLNMAVGGVGAGGPPDNPGDFPADMAIDFVKVWRRTA